MDPTQEQKSVRLRKRLWGAALMIALLVIFLPFLLDGSGSESQSQSQTQYRRVESLRAEPPRIIDSNGQIEITGESAGNTPIIRVNNNGEQTGSSVQGGQTHQATEAGQGQQGSQGGQAQQSDQDGQGGQGQQYVQDGQQSQQGTADGADGQGRQSAQGLQDQQGTQDGQIARSEPNGQVGSLADDDKSIDSDAASQVGTEGGQSPDTEQVSAWVVQAGSFSDEQNALAVRDRLRQAGHPSFVTPTQSDPPVFRVRVGPMIDLQQAESKRDEVIDYLGREAIVVNYP